MVTQNPSKRGFLRPSVSLFLVFFDGVTTLYTASKEWITDCVSEAVNVFEKKRSSLLKTFFGDPFGARTQDPNIKSVVLYQLS